MTYSIQVCHDVANKHNSTIDNEYVMLSVREVPFNFQTVHYLRKE